MYFISLKEGIILIKLILKDAIIKIKQAQSFSPAKKAPPTKSPELVPSQ